MCLFLASFLSLYFSWVKVYWIETAWSSFSKSILSVSIYSFVSWCLFKSFTLHPGHWHWSSSACLLFLRFCRSRLCHLFFIPSRMFMFLVTIVICHMLILSVVAYTCLYYAQMLHFALLMFLPPYHSSFIASSLCWLYLYTSLSNAYPILTAQD